MTMHADTPTRRAARIDPWRRGRCAGVWVGALAVFALLTLAMPAVAQRTDSWDANGGRAGPPVHAVESGRYVVRANAVPSGLLSASTAQRHGVAQAPDRAVLNVVILERQTDGAQVTVPAQVHVRKENLLGQSEEVAMRAVKENGRISYLGEFSFEPLRNFRFVLEVRPEGSGQSIETDFQDRFVARQR